MNVLLEHDSTPGATYEDRLIFGGGGGVFNEMVDLHESADVGVKSLKFRGKFQEAEAVNKNKRSYPHAVLDSNVKRLSEALEAGGLCGELDHPTDSIIHFTNASHKVTKLWWEGNTLMGEGIILNTPSGKILRALINDGVRVGISSRGVGNGKVNEDGILVIGESYRLITFDAVADPSTYAAFQEKVTSSSNKRECITPQPLIMNAAKKNESCGIHNNVSKEVLLACLSGIVSKKANELKARVN
jgi:hypothetical protein